MHLLSVDPGTRFVAVNIAVLLSSSARATVPADQLLVGLLVVAENAEYDAPQTSAPEAMRPVATAPSAMARA